MIFKKQIVTLLAFVILLSQMSWAFTVHFCADKVSSVSINSNINEQDLEKNCCGEVEKDSKCCSNKSFKIKKTSDKFHENTVQLQPKSFISEIQNTSEQFVNIVNYKKSKVLKVYHFLDNLPPIFQRNCQLIFYA